MTLEIMKSTEESLVDEIRHRMKEQMPQHLYEDDHFILRFLRARNFNIDASEAMLRNHMKFRKQYNVDSILTNFTPDKFMDSEYMPITKLGTDLEGAEVTYIHIGNMDTKGTLKACSNKNILNYILHYLERDLRLMKETTLKTGNLADKGVYIFDFENFSLSIATHKPTIEVFIQLLLLYEANYPETLKTAYAINASYYFTLLWGVVKNCISGPTQKKVKMFGKTGWKEDMLQNISPDVLPAFMGGNRTDPDGNPLCKTLIKYGGPVPESCFSYANKTCAARLPGAKKITVHRLSKAEVTLEVLQPHSTIVWEFVVKNRDIGFSVLHREHGDSKAKEVIPQQRIDTSESMESGMYQCEKAGKYIIEFDNTYSWVHRKEIFYKVSVDLPSKPLYA